MTTPSADVRRHELFLARADEVMNSGAAVSPRGLMPGFRPTTLSLNALAIGGIIIVVWR